MRDLGEVERLSVEQWGRKVADKYLDDIEAALDRLVHNPDLLRLEPELATNHFLYRVRKHFLVCALLADTVFVLAVIHTSMDLPRRLAELEPRLIAEMNWLHEKLQRRTKRDE
jgi:toxin ParE1/3/4